MCELATLYHKMIVKSDGCEYLISPFAPMNMTQITDSNFRDAEQSDLNSVSGQKNMPDGPDVPQDFKLSNLTNDQI